MILKGLNLFLSKASYQYLLKERLIAFVRRMLFEKEQQINCAMNH